MTKKAILRRSLVAVVLAMVIAASALVFSGFSGEDDTPFFIEKQLDKRSLGIRFSGCFSYGGRAACIEYDLPDYDLVFETESNDLWFLIPGGSPEGKYVQHSVTITDAAFGYTYLVGDYWAKPRKGEYRGITEDSMTVRVIIREDNRIAGYALLAWWDAGDKNPINPIYGKYSIVKSVLFDEVNGEYPDPTLDEVNALIDEAFQRYVVELDMFNLSVQEFEALRNAEWKAEAELMAAAKTRAEEKAREAEAPAEEPMGEGEAPIAKVTPEPEAPTGEGEVPAVKVTPEPEAPAEGPMDEGEDPVVKVTPEP